MLSKNKIPVAVFIRAGEDNRDYLTDVKKTVTDFCLKKGYKITKVIVEDEPIYEFLSSSIRDIIEERHHAEYRKLITFKLDDIALSKEEVYGVALMLEDNEVILESMCEGEFRTDFLFDYTLNINVKGKKEIEDARKIRLRSNVF